MPHESDDNLLFGVLALQDRLISSDTFVDECSAWASRPEESLADRLERKKLIDHPARVKVDRRMKEWLERFGGDARAALGAAATPEVRDSLRLADSPPIRDSLRRLPLAEGYVAAGETVVPPPVDHAERYAVLNTIDEGGNGQIKRATDSWLRRDVVVKEVHSKIWASQRDWEKRKSRHEAQVAAQLEHPNIVPVYDIATRPPDDKPYYIMRYVTGPTLDLAIEAYHRNGRDESRLWELLNHFVSICNAVAYAHSRGVIHRDLKPRNVKLGGFGEVQVLDWGLARLVDRPDDDEDRPRVMVGEDVAPGESLGQSGTPAYMAPEQARGDKGAIGPQTDVYGLGAVLFEILTGRPPAIGVEIYKIIEAGVPRPRDVRPDVKRPLDAICAKALAKKPRDRYHGAKALAADIKEFLAGKPVSAYAESLPERFARWEQKYRKIMRVIGIFCSILLIGALTAAFWLDKEHQVARKNEKKALESAKEADRNANKARESETEVRLQAAKFYLDRGLSLSESTSEREGLLWIAKALEEAPDPQKAPSDASQGAARVLQDRIRLHLAVRAQDFCRPIATIAYPTGLVHDVVFSPDGKVLATVGEDDTIKLWDVATHRPICQPLSHDGKAIFSVAFSPPDGRILATGGEDGKVRLWESATGKPVGKPMVLGKPILEVAYSFDGRFLVSSGAQAGPGGREQASPTDGEARLWDVASGKPIGQPLRHDGELVAVFFGPRSHTLATAGLNSGRVQLWDAATGRPIGQPLDHDGKSIQAIAFAPDGRILATTGEDGTARLWDAMSGRSLGKILRHDGKALNQAAFSPDGKTLATAGEDGTAWLWDVATGQAVGRPLRHDGNPIGIVFGPNIIATTGRDASVRLWDPATGEPIGQPLRHDGAPIYQVLFSPDGRILATTGGDRTARLWEMPTGRPIGAPLEHDGALVVKLAFRPDSLLLASAGGDSSARLWDAVRGRQVDRPLRHAGLPKQRRESNEFAYSADGRILAILDDEGKVHLSDGQTGRPMGKRLRHDGGRIEQFSFSRDGKSLATAGPQNKSGGSSVCLWDVNTWRLRGQPMLFPASEPVRQIAFTPHRALLATIQGLSIPPDKETVLVRFWDIATGESRGTPLRLADVSIEGIERIVFSPNGRSLATIDRSPGVATLWYLAMGKLIGQKIQHKDSDIKDVEFSPDGRVLASAGDDGIVRLWDAVSGNPHGRTFSPDKSRLPDGILPGIVSFWDVVFSPDGRLLAAAGEDGSYLWDVETGERRAIHTVAQGKDVTSIMLRQRHDRIVFRPDGRVIATIGDGIVRLWDVETARMIANPIDIGNHRIDRVAFHPSGKHLATGALDGTVRLWDLPRRQELRQLSYSADGDEYGGIQKNNFVISPNGRMLATISADGSARLRDAASGQTISPELRHDGKPINSLGFGEFGAPLITLTSNSGEPDQCGTVRLWDPSTGQPLLTRHARELDAAKKFAISSDGRFLALVSKDNTVQCWELKTDRPFGIETRCGVKTIADLVLSPDGKALATVAADGEARLWDMATGLSRGGELVHEGTPVTRSIFGPDGRCLATSSKDGMVRLWDVQTGAPIGQPILGEGAPSRFFIEPSDRGTEVLFGPGGRVVATQNRGRVSLWDAATGKLRGEAALQDGYSWSSMCFSPDESILAVASGSSVALYSTATGQSIGDLNHIGVTIHSLEFGSPKFGSGMILATVCDDGTARLWDVEVQAPIGQPLQHGESHDGISGVHFLPDGRSLLISSDSRVWLWRNVLPADSGESRDILASQCRKLVAARLGERGVLIDDDPPAISDPKEDAAEDPWFFDLAADKDDRAWDAITARKALEQGDYFGALWHLDRLIASDPKDLEVQELRARVFRKRAQKHYERGAFSDEVDDLSLFLKLKPNDYEMWVYHQFAVLNLGRISRFKEGCVTLVDRFEMKSDPNQKNMIAWICALVPDALPDLSRAVRLSEDAVAAVPNPMWRKTLGALLYRVGRYEDAARQLHEAVSTKGGLEKASMEDLLFLAMVNKKLGKGAEAEDCLARAEEKLAREEKMVVRVPKVIYDDTTYNMLQREEERQWPMLQREAVSLIRGVAASKQVGSSIPR